MESSPSLTQIQEAIHGQKSVYKSARVELIASGGEDQVHLRAMTKAASDLHDLRQVRNQARNAIGINRKGEPITSDAKKYYSERERRRNHEEVLQEILRDTKEKRNL